ncbi:hypothetical protein OUY_00470 [Wolbachia endosymbiont of Leptopilina clavipes]|uniref:hypothetical protein n=1 Tax=Wolbachia endosymbiont of Leptopilina clavipes TaxID=260213 RepID=UPI00111A7416|nr:hypothetical protein [Wolbachia endosymbiont of Leptopilina clavipes]TNK94689.1 hypothetical protein OUY_00470 [Wolbachia endosymbiont of Leptopilina clavipes]
MAANDQKFTTITEVYTRGLKGDAKREFWQNDLSMHNKIQICIIDDQMSFMLSLYIEKILKLKKA